MTNDESSALSSPAAHPAIQAGSAQARSRPCADEGSECSSSPASFLVLLEEHRTALGAAVVLLFTWVILASLKGTETFGAQVILYSLTFVLGSLFASLLVAYRLRRLLAAFKRMRTQHANDGGEAGSHPLGNDVISRLVDEAAYLESVFSGLRLERDTIYARHELITTNIAASVIIRDTSGKILFCSPYTQVLTGYSLDEIYDYDGDFFERIVVDEDRPRYQRAQMVSALAEDISVKYRIQHRSGLKIWLETRLVPVCNEQGELVSIMSVAIDVTDTLSYQKQIEEQNRDQSDFAYMVSHDLKAPIFTIKGMASAVLEDHRDALGEDGRGLIEHIVDATKRLEQLVASVIEYSSIASKDAQAGEVQLNAVIDNARADLAELIRSKNAKIQVDADLPSVNANPVRIYQVFSNLIGNALKYSSPERQPEIIISRRRAPGLPIVIEIKDNGIGIPERKIGDIFRPYHRAHGNQIEGSGIGLACVKKIMDGIGGNVSVTSVEGEGSTFVVTFPPPPPKPRAIPEDLARVFQ
ncbi:MAG: ATP-binding protein [Bdellovibrionota bacterium]